MFEKEIVKVIKDFLNEIGIENNILQGDLLEKEVKEFLVHEPNAFFTRFNC